jgi:hypothetical protein
MEKMKTQDEIIKIIDKMMSEVFKQHIKMYVSNDYSGSNAAGDKYLCLSELRNKILETNL